MGQPLPLPERIPRPDSKKQMAELEEAGVILEDSTERYVGYTMPKGWKMVDDSWREDLPQFYIVDDKNMARFSIHGSWKGTYDNALTLTTVDTPRLFERRNRDQSLIPSETSDGALVGKFAEAADPFYAP